MTSTRLHGLRVLILARPTTLLSCHACLSQHRLQLLLTARFRRQLSQRALHSATTQLPPTAVPSTARSQLANNDEVAVRVQSLRSTLQHHSDRYYNKGDSAVTDDQYDALKAQLNILETANPTLRTPDSPTQTVGTPPSHAAVASRLVAHRFPMLSLDSTNDPAALVTFMSSLQQSQRSQQPYPFILELKYDGMAISLLYRHGQLVRASTRGDGQRGEDVTAAFLRRVDNTPLHVNKLDATLSKLERSEADDVREVAQLLNDNDEFEVRGEVVLSKAEYDRYTTAAAAVTKQPNESIASDAPSARSPRNLAVGLMRRTRQDEVDGVPLPRLQFIGYSLHLSADQHAPSATHANNGHTSLSASIVDSQSGRLRVLERLGFTVSSHTSLHTEPSTVLTAFDAIVRERQSLPYDIDGVVVKLDHLPTARSLASSTTAPRWAIACKFKPASAITRVNGVKWGVGRTGRLVPVAEVVPVLVGGAEVSNVLLHGERWRSAFGVRPGVRVEIERRGDVTPYISRVVDESAAHEQLTIEVCPCERRSQLHRSDDGELYCREGDCPSQLLAQVLNYVSRAALNANALGQQTAEILISLRLLTSLRDLPLLCVEPQLSRTRNILLQQPRWGERRVRQLFTSLQSAHRDADDAQLLTAAGLDGFGSVMCRRLLDEVGSIERLMSITDVQLTQVASLASGRWHSLRTQLHDRAELLQAMQFVRQQLRGQQQPAVRADKQSTANPSQPLRGVRFVLTGTLSSSRAQLSRRIRQAGGQIVTSVSSQTSYVVAGVARDADAVEVGERSKKLRDAERLGVQVIGEEQLNAMLDLR